MATTTNYGWTTPDDTALVKDGASAIRTLGSSVDTTVKNLNPETTLGDISYRSSTANTNTRLAIGTSGQVLTVSSGVPAWVTPAGSGASWTLLNSGGTALTGAATITVSGISAQNQLMIIIQDASSASAESTMSLRFNADNTTKYNVFGSLRSFSTTYTRDAAEQSTKGQSTGQTEIILGRISSTTTSSLSSFCLVSGTNSTNTKIFHQATGIDVSNGNNSFTRNTGGYYTGSSAITSVSVLSDTGNFDAGTIFVYGSAV